MKIGQRVSHKKYGKGIIIPSDSVSNSKIMVRWDDKKTVDMYVGLDGILHSELKEIKW